MSRTVIIIIGILIIAGGYLFYRSRTSTTPSPSPTPSVSAEPSATPTLTPTPAPTPTFPEFPSSTPAPHFAIPPNMGLAKFDVYTIGFRFDPKMITVKSGQKVEIDLHNNDTLPHDFTIAGLNVATKKIDPGGTGVIKFTASGNGNYTFYSSIPGDAQAGLIGIFRVE